MCSNSLLKAYMQLYIVYPSILPSFSLPSISPQFSYPLPSPSLPPNARNFSFTTEKLVRLEDCAWIKTLHVPGGLYVLLCIQIVEHSTVQGYYPVVWKVEHEWWRFEWRFCRGALQGWCYSKCFMTYITVTMSMPSFFLRFTEMIIGNRFASLMYLDCKWQ